MARRNKRVQHQVKTEETPPPHGLEEDLMLGDFEGTEEWDLNDAADWVIEP